MFLSLYGGYLHLWTLTFWEAVDFRLDPQKTKMGQQQCKLHAWVGL